MPTACLTTADKPVYTDEIRSQNAKRGELVDMEGAAVAKTCNLLGVKVHLIKIISDFANQKAKKDIKQNIQSASIKLAKILWNGLSNV